MEIGSSTLLLSNNKYVSFEILNPPTQYSNELHICDGENWRNSQIRGYLDDGNVYNAYCSKANVNTKLWNSKGKIVTFKIDENTNKASFYIDDILEDVFDLPNKSFHLSLRVHKMGHLKILN